MAVVDRRALVSAKYTSSPEAHGSALGIADLSHVIHESGEAHIRV
jgi:hypothetical protein